MYIVVFPIGVGEEIYYCDTLDEVKQIIKDIDILGVRVFQVAREIPVTEIMKMVEKDFEKYFQRMLKEDQELIKELPYTQEQLRDIYKRDYEYKKEMAEKNPLHKLVQEIVEKDINSHTGLTEEEYQILEDHLDPELNRGDSIEELINEQLQKRNKEIDENIRRIDDLSEKLKDALEDENSFNEGLNFVFENYSETLKGLLEKKRMEREEKRKESKRKTDEFVKGLWTKHHEKGQ